MSSYRIRTNNTLLLEFGIVREDVQREGVVPGVDKLDGLVEIVDGDDGQNRCKDLTGKSGSQVGPLPTLIKPWSLTRSLENHRNQHP